MTETKFRDKRVDTGTRKLWVNVVSRLAAGALILILLFWISQDAGEEIKAFEAWIKDMGMLAPFMFIVAVVILTSVLFPATPLAAVAGAVFGLGWGVLIMFTAGILTAVLDYQLANKLFRERVNSALQRHPKLLAIQHAAQQKNGLRLQFMLRLTPINSAMVNYVLGASGVRFPPYLLATVGLLPGSFMDVFFGHLAKHVATTAANVNPHSTLHLVMTIGGFIVCVAIMLAITRMAKRTLAEAQQDAGNRK